ncbi:PREDICTED: pentatricopeptide repeat-containing protein At1g02150 [Prunus mume]|uniref:Pentatricopeptide repeat-containing protein At1g02150 n=1 Tax=Prunus mume TaxID=102107 RepID=A0ABM0NZY8_PRUMU|nr:PREDICTED: pentatricopeptide repeat-containing protein At1g02150 [Prunus mume]
MPLQTSVHHRHHNLPLSSSLSYSTILPCKIPTLPLPSSINFQRLPSISCSISQVHNYGTVDYERRPMVKWNAIYRKISLTDDPEVRSADVLNQWEKEGRKLTKWELCRVVKELRKYKRYDRALEVYDWMSNRGERFRISTSDAAIQLDLVAKVRGVASAENYFLSLPDTLKDRRIYGALLNAYVRTRMKEKAESLLDKMRSKGHALQSLPFNVMMTLYMNLKEYDKVDSIISEMMEKNIQLDIYSYNIWLSSRGSQGSEERMEQVFEQMKLDRTVNPNWTTFSTMATMYIKMGQLEKAEACLKKVESRITGRDRIPYHYLLSLYGNVGNKEELYRVWNIYKSSFPSIPNLGYHAIMSSLLRVGDVEGAEKIYEEWLTVKSTYDPRIANVFIAYYIKDGDFEKAQSFYDHMVDVGGKPNSSTWETLAEGHTEEQRISEALSCWKEAFSAEGSKSWRPKPVNVSAFLELCEQEANSVSKEVFMGLLKQSGQLKNKSYASLIGLADEDVSDDDLSLKKDRTNITNDDDDEKEAGDGSELLLNELQGTTL